jgi:hypothetical protein
MRKILLFLLIIILSCSRGEEGIQYDVIVYGGTPSGIIAAVAAARNNTKVLLIEQTRHLGGMYTSGLNTAETNHIINNSITGYAREFYIRMGKYFSPEYFETFPNGRRLNFKVGDPAFFFESPVAEEVFNNMIKEEKIAVKYNSFVTFVQKSGKKIKYITLNDTLEISGKVFIDCTYEGDLMEHSGVSYTYGRESKSMYGESYAGIRLIDDTSYVKITVEDGNLLNNYFTDVSKLAAGEGDNRVLCYNFRPTMTKDENKKIDITRPPKYDSTKYTLLANFLKQSPNTALNGLIGIIPKGSAKYEFNNKQNAIISIGLLGGNVDYPDADYARRKEIYKEHKLYTLGYLYFLGYDSRVPEKLRREMLSYGFHKDEFRDNNHFPYYLYIREARRMKGDFVGTEKDILTEKTKHDAVALGSHWIDAHHIQRVAISDSSFTNEGRIWHKITEPYELSYRLLLPRQEDCVNLLVPVCASLSHVAFCSYRVEPTWMQMGHVAGTAASMSLKHENNVHMIDTKALQKEIMEEGMIIKIDNLGLYYDYEIDY